MRQNAHNCQIMLNYHNIWLRYATWVEATPRFVMSKFYACVIDCSIFIKTTKTAYQLKSNQVTVASIINLADELLILLILIIFFNNEHFANTFTVGKVSHADKMRMQRAECRRCVGRDSQQFSKTNNSYVGYKNKRNTLDCDKSNVYSSRDIFSPISPNLPLCSFSLCFRSASDPVLRNKWPISYHMRQQSL